MTANNMCTCYSNRTYNMLSQQISFICKNKYNYFLSKPNVQAVGLGYKESQGITTNELCIKCFVSRKIPSCNLSNFDIIPLTYNGLKTDVVESGVFTSCSLTGKVRPAPGGYSVGPAGSNTSGTIGCLARGSSSRDLYILSTNHTLARLGKVKLCTPTLQPAVPDGGIAPRDTIANLFKYVPIKLKTIFHTPENHADCALSKVTDHSLVSSQIALVNKNIKGLGSAEIAEQIFKIGRTTERTSGSVTAIDATQMVNYPEGSALFKDQILTSAQGNVGDSGSILLNHKMEALGMLTSASKDFTCFNNMVYILSLLQIQLVTQSDFNNIFF